MTRLLSVAWLALLVVTLPLAGCAADTSGSTPAAAPAASDAPQHALPPSRAQGAAAAADYETALSELLAAVVTPAGHVHYDRLRGEQHEAFRRVLRAVEDFDAATLQSQSEKMAFWINAYNVQMLANILDAWPVRDVSAHAEAFFEEPLRTAGMALSLDDIENEILRRQGTTERLQALQPDSLDPRLHAAVNCAARSCPKLRQQAFTPENVDALLDTAMRDFTGSAGHFRRDEGGGFVFNSIVKWYGADFDRPDGTPAGDYLLSFMPQYRPDREALRGVLEGRTAAQLQQRDDVSFAYDWTLNATPTSLPASDGDSSS